MAETPIVCFDFDGVIHPYRKGPDVPLEHPANQEVVETIKELHKLGWKIVVLSSRASTVEGRNEIYQYLYEEGIFLCVESVTDRKIPARVYVDDRAIQYNGHSSTLLRDIITFKSHTEGRV